MTIFECEDVEHNLHLIEAWTPLEAAQEFARRHDMAISVSQAWENDGVFWFDARVNGELIDNYRVQEAKS